MSAGAGTGARGGHRPAFRVARPVLVRDGDRRRVPGAVHRDGAAPAAAQRRPVRPLGTVLLAVALVALLLGISKGGSWGWSSATTVGLFASSLLVFAVFGWWQLRVDSPIVDLRTTARRPVLTTNLASIGWGSRCSRCRSSPRRCWRCPRRQGSVWSRRCCRRACGCPRRIGHDAQFSDCRPGRRPAGAAVHADRRLPVIAASYPGGPRYSAAR